MQTSVKALGVLPAGSFKVAVVEPTGSSIPAVRIAEMPDRVTTTVLERNSAGEIVSSVQVEKDA